MNLSVTIARRHSNKHLPIGQSVRQRRPVVALAGLALLFLAAITTTGCQSIYHQTRSGLPPEPAAEVELRINEARQAADRAHLAGKKLLGHLRQGKVDSTLSADFDRLETAAFEVERRALAARDAAERNGANPDVPAEIERLLRNAQAWLAYVQSNRSADRATQIGQLEALLDRTAD